ncbi:unnamed protein product [Moneuplotes crassus]|uniref:Uncharacterized protein n=1 Tax=Euplotes crassus TaxID=5936 RepID=A0AAD1UNZ4_EUPCR|nr:unnamed protein product [Moneuplotes crassus]
MSEDLLRKFEDVRRKVIIEEILCQKLYEPLVIKQTINFAEYKKKKYHEYVHKEIDKAQELRLEKEIAMKLSAVDDALNKAKEIQVVTTGNKHLNAYGFNKKEPKPSKIPELSKSKGASITKKNSIIGKRDKRFMFNNKNMKIGERKRNEFTKSTNDNINGSSKSHRSMASYKANNLKQVEKQKEEPEEEEKIIEDKKPKKYQNRLESIYVDKIPYKTFKPHKEFITRKKELRAIEDEYDEGIDLKGPLAIRAKLLSKGSTKSELKPTKYFGSFQTFCLNKCALSKIALQLLSQDFSKIPNGDPQDLQSQFLLYYQRWLYTKILKDNYEFCQKYVESFVQQEKAIKLYVNSVFSTEREKPDLYKQTFNTLIKQLCAVKLTPKSSQEDPEGPTAQLKALKNDHRWKKIDRAIKYTL